MTRMKDSLAIAERILKTLITNKVQSITHLKLQKLIYYCQAWSLVFYERRLFQENIEAWVHGPVVPSVYHFYKRYGYSDISVNSKDADESYLDRQAIEVINIVCNVYGQFTPKYLEYLTHSEFPWKNARSGLMPSKKSNRSISLSDMKEYYSTFASKKHPGVVDPMATSTEKNKLAKQSSKLSNMLEGAGSVMDIFPCGSTGKSNLSNYKISDFSGMDSDIEALSSDWDKVGSDIYLSINSVKKYQKRRHE